MAQKVSQQPCMRGGVSHLNRLGLSFPSSRQALSRKSVLEAMEGLYPYNWVTVLFRSFG
jgi:hypothetical protein